MKLAASVLALGALLILGYLTFSYSHYLECSECHSTQDVKEWRFGLDIDRSVPVLPASRTLNESRVLRDLYPSSHKHAWEAGAFFNTKVFFGLGGGSIACGQGPHQLVVRYEDDPGFREFVGKRIASGELSREHLRALVALPSRRREVEQLGAAGRHLDGERKALVEQYESTRSHPTWR